MLTCRCLYLFADGFVIFAASIIIYNVFPITNIAKNLLIQWISNIINRSGYSQLLIISDIDCICFISVTSNAMQYTDDEEEMNVSDVSGSTRGSEKHITTTIAREQSTVITTNALPSGASTELRKMNDIGQCKSYLLRVKNEQYFEIKTWEWLIKINK